MRSSITRPGAGGQASRQKLSIVQEPPARAACRAWARDVCALHRTVYRQGCERRARLEIFATRNSLVGLGPFIVAHLGFPLLDEVAELPAMARAAQALREELEVLS
jgi:hypothetical protein